MKIDSSSNPSMFNKKKWIISWMGLWHTVDTTWVTKIQNWRTPHKCSSLRSPGKSNLSIFIHWLQCYESSKSPSCSLNTLYIISEEFWWIFKKKFWWMINSNQFWLILLWTIPIRPGNFYKFTSDESRRTHSIRQNTSSIQKYWNHHHLFQMCYKMWM